MSNTTSVFIWGLFANENIKEINKWLKDHKHNTIKDIDLANSGGEKCMRPCVLAGGYDYLNQLEFIRFLKSLTWRSPTIMNIWNTDFPKIIRLGWK